MAALFQATERAFGPKWRLRRPCATPSLSRLKAGNVLKALRDSASIPRRQLERWSGWLAVKLRRSTSPTRHLISRHTRELLRRYFKAGKLGTPIADREVHDEFIDLLERRAVDLRGGGGLHLLDVQQRIGGPEQNAVGFVMTIYRKRLSSSFYALKRTLEERLAFVQGQASLPFDELRPARMLRTTLMNPAMPQTRTWSMHKSRRPSNWKNRRILRRFLSKSAGFRLIPRLSGLPMCCGHSSGSYHAMDHSLLPAFPQAIVFTQYTDTLDYLRDFLKTEGFTVLCYSGRGGEWLLPGRQVEIADTRGNQAPLQTPGGPGVGMYGCSGRRPELPVLRRSYQFRLALEPHAHRAAHRPR